MHDYYQKRHILHVKCIFSLNESNRIQKHLFFSSNVTCVQLYMYNVYLRYSVHLCHCLLLSNVEIMLNFSTRIEQKRTTPRTHNLSAISKRDTKKNAGFHVPCVLHLHSLSCTNRYVHFVCFVSIANVKEMVCHAVSLGACLLPVPQFQIGVV